MQFGKLAILTALFVAQAPDTQLLAQDNSTVTAKPPRYRMVDLGTFGGPVSLLYGGTGNLNQQKTLVTDSADTSVLDPDYATISPIFAGDPYIQHAFFSRGGQLTDLGTLPGGTSSSGQGVNKRGVVSGLSTNGAIDPLTGFAEIRPVLWRDGEILDIGTLGGNQGFAISINDRDQVTGGVLNAIPDPFAASFFFGVGATQVHAFLWDRDVMQDLGTLGGPDSLAYYINLHGDIAGVSFTSDVPNETTGIPTLDPFLWRDGRMLDLGTLGGTIANVWALNNRGQVVGTSNLAGDAAFHPFLWDRGSLLDLGTFGGNNGEATWMNDDGAVVGYATFPGDSRWDAFLWRRGVMTDLGNLGCASGAWGINATGQIVGNSRLADCKTVHAFLWEGGRMYDLNDLIPAGSGLVLQETHQINDAGVIGGNGLPPGCTDVHACGHAYLLFPCDDKDGEKCESNR